jgi:hypothetical protein
MRCNSRIRFATVAGTLSVLLAADAAWSQIIPNPLMRPSRTEQAQQPGTATPEPAGRGDRSTVAPTRTPRRAAEGEGLPAEPETPKSSSERLANLYVSAVIGDRAVLRSLEVRTVPRLGSASAGSASASGSGGAPGGESGGGGVVSTGGGDIAGLRSQVYVVRNGEVIPFLDRLRVLVRVRDTTVTLFDVTDVPAGNYDPLDMLDRGFPVAFRGSVDSIQTAPPIPGGLAAPSGGLDGDAFDRSRDTTRGIDARSGGPTGGSTSGGTGSP